MFQEYFIRSIQLIRDCGFAFSSEVYLERVAGVGVIAMTRSDGCLLTDEIRDLLEFAAVNVAVSVQIEHFEGDFKVTT